MVTLAHYGAAISQQSALAPLFLLLIEEAGVPIFVPGDAILVYTGYNIQSSHHASFLLAFITATAAVLCGSSILFFAARRYGQNLIMRLGGFMFLKPRHIQRAEQLFKRYGVWTIIIGRHIPGMRIPITVFAATSGVRYRTFILSTFVSTALWIWLYLSVGRHYGTDIRHLLSRSIVAGVSVAVGFLAVIVGLHLYGNRRKKNI